MNSMRLCLVAPLLGEASANEKESLDGTLGGTSRIAHELATNLARAGHTVTAVTDCPSQNVSHLNREYETFTVGSRFSITNVARFVRVIETIKPDVVHFHGGELMSIYARLFKSKSSMPGVHTFTFIPSLMRKSAKLKARAELWLSKVLLARVLRESRLDHVIVLTEFAKQRLISEDRFSAGQISVVPYGLPRESDPEHVEENENQAGVICISGTRTGRGFSTFLSALPKIRSVFPGVRIALAVRDKEDLRFVEKTHIHGLQVMGPGRLSESVSSHNIVVMPFWEHVAVDPTISMLECMSWGKQIISTPIASIPEIVGLDRGILVPSRNPAALTNGILQLLGNESLGQSIRMNAQGFIDATYRWDVAINSILNIYLQCMSR